MEQLFSRAFDNFSDVQRRLQKRVDAALGRDAPNWNMRYGCPACGFEVCSPLQNMSQCVHTFFSNQMKKALSLHGCMPLTAAILKNATRQRAHATSALLTASFFSLAASWTVSKTRSSLMQPHEGLRTTPRMLWILKMALWLQRASTTTAAGATGRPRLRRSFHPHQRRRSSRQGSLPACVGTELWSS
jgi:hypothetical protein